MNYSTIYFIGVAQGFILCTTRGMSKKVAKNSTQR